jgi:hypothetical protein
MERKKGGVWGRYSACPHPFLQQASGHIDDVNGFTSTAEICFMLETYGYNYKVGGKNLNRREVKFELLTA